MKFGVGAGTALHEPSCQSGCPFPGFGLQGRARIIHSRGSLRGVRLAGLLSVLFRRGRVAECAVADWRRGPWSLAGRLRPRR